MNIRDILDCIEYTVIIDGVADENRDIVFSTWNGNVIEESQKSSGYTPKKTFDPVARDNYQKYVSVAYYAGLLPAKVVETRTNEIGADGCYIFKVETFGRLFPSTDNTDSKAKIEKLSNTNGHFSKNGKSYVLVRQAYIDGPIDEPYFVAPAICVSDGVDEDGLYLVYNITWYPTQEWLDGDHQEDEGSACDWDVPDDISTIGARYDLQSDRML